MDSERILAQVGDVVRELFDEYEGPVDRQLSAKQVPEWDSLAHVQLLVMVERTFGVKFSGAEIRELQTVGDLVDLVERKSAG